MIKIRNDDVKIKCHKCGNEYEMSMMRMDPSSKMNLACKNCLDRRQGALPKPAPLTSDFRSEPKPKESQKSQQEMTEYFCKECKYNFKRASHLHISRCPYCGSDGTVMQKGSTSRIIADASRMKDKNV